MPVYDDVPPIKDGLDPERNAVLKIYNWEQYIWKRVIDEFAEKYDVRVEVTNFANMDELLAMMRSGKADFDVMFQRIDVLGTLAEEKLLRPLNHSYIPNLEEHTWHVYLNPFYDQGARYTVPYTVYTTGIAWRIDQVPEDIPSMDNPYDIFWNRDYKGRIHLMNDYREVIGMALLRNGYKDLNTRDRRRLRMAQETLAEGADLIGGLSVDAYTDLPNGRSWIHQAYSGDMVSAQYYFPKGADPTVVRYWTPPDGSGAVGNDTISIPNGGKNPVLAHHFLNYLLDSKTSMNNFSWNGFQPPQKVADPERLVGEGYVPPYVRSAVVRPDAFNQGAMELELSSPVDKLWRAAWKDFTSRI